MHETFQVKIGKCLLHRRVSFKPIINKFHSDTVHLYTNYNPGIFMEENEIYFDTLTKINIMV